jgi:chorismate dehydratase
LALDEGSRTSAVLVRILLAERLAVDPRLESLPLSRRLEESAADAVLLIGDRAIHSPPGCFTAVWDLGDEWYRWTGLPFVFAMWAAREEVDTERLAPVLSAARDEGLREVAQIAEMEAPKLGLTRPQCEDYLRRHLHFILGSQEKSGLALFRQKAERLELPAPGSPFHKGLSGSLERRSNPLGAGSR